ncbi:MAG: NAD(P)H-hydrate dehydratase [Ruminococcaceae bacterium]|nr:NAD(P)H-hydrate dehydratase [Oscillospiraceae bacterium]
MNIIETKDILSVIKPRDPKANKGSFGKLLVVAGCENYRGATYLAVTGALRSGIGIVGLASTEEVISSVSSRIAECTYFPLIKNSEGHISKDNAENLLEISGNYSAVLIGCGMSCSKDTGTLVQKLLRSSDTPIVIDADGLNSIKDRPYVLSEAKQTPIITPHIKEFSRLCGKSCEEILEEPEKSSKEFSDKYGCTVVLKNYDTVIASPGRESMLNTVGNVGLAKGGSGDLLAGIIASLRAQGMDPYEASYCGTYIHGSAADICAEKMSRISMLPSDVALCIDEFFKRIGL